MIEAFQLTLYTRGISVGNKWPTILHLEFCGQLKSLHIHFAHSIFITCNFVGLFYGKYIASQECVRFGWTHQVSSVFSL